VRAGRWRGPGVWFWAIKVVRKAARVRIDRSKWSRFMEA